MGLFGPELSSLDKGLEAFAKRQWKKARAHLEDAAIENRSTAGDYHLGLLYWRGLGGPEDRVAAHHCFRRAADTGHAAAQTALAIALRDKGAGGRDEAHALFRSAAGAGDPAAMTELAQFCARGDAMDLLERASAQDHAPAMRALSDLWLEDDMIEALAWIYAAAASTGLREDMRRAHQIAQEMTAGEIAAAQKLGKTRFKRLQEMRKL